ncbi:uncharacterized protein C8Q71DRAFT_859885 [Rhodofomes roseus]|uniref:Uncharacterized protein n=1 Tax=Rhodofomes roseus TaxID=34475 RepID=A0ABQ8KBB8_9APHY|nr:uncharacterized protein C8Q71DRAFT_859885 [Rhodofomes roseus]KAH9834230.1 hypothetical protein C8Q71DRAFT_859885 [Rhodofomes roseus]
MPPANTSQGGRGGQGTARNPLAPSSTSTAGIDGQAAAGLNTTDQAIEDLLDTMNQTLKTLGSTFESLGKQTVTVASLSPRIEAAHEIHRTGEQLQMRQTAQDKRLKDMSEVLKANVKEQRKQWLDAKVNELVAQIVSKKVAHRVDLELNVQIPSALKDEVNEYKRRIAQVKVKLHNSEAKRKNSLIPPYAPSGDEPLDYLLPPLSESQIDMPPRPALFPPNLRALLQLNSQQLSSLLQLYGIEEVTEVTAASPLSPGGAAREQNLNQFMSFIGVGLLALPPPAVAEGAEGNFLMSPVVTRRHGWRPFEGTRV